MKHEFVQDDKFNFKTCKTCGMWPRYHEHLYRAGGCVCNACMTEAEQLPDWSTPGDCND
jgi:hypothetical protein